jgi:hypothetical protein
MSGLTRSSVGAAGDVAPYPIGRVGRDAGAVALPCPKGEAAQAFEIGLRLGIDDLKSGRERAGLGNGHPRNDAQRPRCPIDRRDDAAAVIGDRRYHRRRLGARLPVRRRLAGLPPQSVDRQW